MIDIAIFGDHIQGLETGERMSLNRDGKIVGNEAAYLSQSPFYVNKINPSLNHAELKLN